MNTIQPLLVPCTGTLADLHVTVDQMAPTDFTVYWGTALLQRVPNDKNSVLFRIIVALLLNLNFRIGSVAKAFGVSEKPLRRWRDALKHGDWASIGGNNDGLLTRVKLRPDVERFIRGSYRQACGKNSGRMPYGFRKRLAEQVSTIWPDQQVCEETLRQFFRDEDRIKSSANEVTEIGEEPSPISLAESENLTSTGSAAPSGSTGGEALWIDRDDDNNHKSSADYNNGLSSDNQKNRDLTCESSTSVDPESSHPGQGGWPTSRQMSALDNADYRSVTTYSNPDDSHRKLPLSGALADNRSGMLSANLTDISNSNEERKPIINVDEPVDLAPSSSQAPSVTAEMERLSRHQASSDNRKLSPDFSGDLSSEGDEKRELAGDSSEQLSATQNSSKAKCFLPIDRQAKGPPKSPCFPLLSGEQPRQPFISQHAGLLLLAPEFDQAFGNLPAILRQTGAQILTGCVNQEQGKLIDYNGFKQIVGKVIRDLERQRTLLDLLAEQGAEKLVYEGNIRLLKLRSADELILYCDTHHSEYTGCEQILLAWSGQQKKVKRGIMMEFFHTAEGQPCMIGHYDNFYDGRQRFFLLRERLVEHLRPWSGHFVWIHDRGYWSYDFLRQIVECGDLFIQWEKNYKQDGWDEPYQKEGQFSMTLQGNSSRDQRQQIEIKWREQKWERFANGRRFIVRVKHASGQSGEVAIVTCHPTMPAEKVIRLMLSRFLQENDFSYLNRHVGINELTARKFDRYEAIAHELQDRNIDSRAYKKTKKQKLALQEKLKQCLFKLDGLPEVSLATLEKQRIRMQQQRERLAQKISLLEPATATDKGIARLSRKVRQLKEKFRLNSDQHVVAGERQAEEAKRRQFHQQIDEVKGQLDQLNRTESRLLMLIEERYMRPNMDRKALVDTVRITSRNTFCQVLKEFRPYYDNYRDDHVVLRALTHAAGVIIPLPNRIDVYLLPRLDRQPEQWDRIAPFLRDRETQIEKRFETRVRFLVGRSDEQIFHAVSRARRRKNDLSE